VLRRSFSPRIDGSSLRRAAGLAIRTCDQIVRATQLWCEIGLKPVGWWSKSALDLS
jgi:hypothetical protein